MIRIRKTLCLLFILLLITALACADEFSNSYIPCHCIGECTCFIQNGDEGNFVKVIITELIKKNYLSKSTPKKIFSDEVEYAVKKFQTDNNLEPTGKMDDDTLTLLLWNMTPNELDRAQPSLATGMVYIPTDGGKKRHLNPSCSKMEDPRKVSIRNAEKAGFDSCKKCGD